MKQLLEMLKAELKESGHILSIDFILEFIDTNKELVVNSYIDGQSHSFSNYKDAEDYYNQVFKNK